MATTVFIYSEQFLHSARSELEDDLAVFLGQTGQIAGGGSGVSGWNIDIELTNNIDVTDWIDRFSEFLQEWGVPEDTYFDVIDDDSNERMQFYVFPPLESEQDDG